MDIYTTMYMLAAISARPPMHTFFRDRYFPTNTELDIFGTSRVFVDYKEGKKKLAPFVVPRIGGVSILRSGFETFELEPANISLKRPLTIDHLEQRGFGESLLSTRTPADREAFYLMDDMRELSDRISRREEWMAVQTMLNNGCIMKHITDREDVAFEDVEVRYYTGGDNPAIYTPSKPWTEGDDSWRQDIKMMVKALSASGLPAADLTVAPDVGEFIERDEWVMKVLDNKNMEYGSLKPEELTNGTTFLGRLNFGGKMLNIIISEETYEDDKGKDTPYLPDGSVIVTAPGCGHTLYGGVTQMEDDKKYHTHAAKRVPKLTVDTTHETKETKLTSKPLMAPKSKDPYRVAKKVFD